MTVVGLVGVAWVWGEVCDCAEVGGGAGVLVAVCVGLMIGGVCAVLFVVTGFVPELSSALV